MTTINTFEDILETMERNPALRDAMRRQVLTEGQAELSASVARLTEGQAELSASVARLTEGQAELSASVARLTEGQAELSASVARLTEGQAELHSSVARLTEGQARLTEGQAKLTEGQAKLTEGQAELHSSVARLMEEQVRLTRGQGRMSGELSNLTGSNYERRASRVVLRRLKRLFNIDPSEIIRSDAVLDNPDISILMGRAIDAGIVSEDEAEDMELADIIIRGQDPDAATVYAVVETSVTVHGDDIERASQRAAILRRAIGGTVHAVVVGEAAASADLEFAELANVTFFQLMERKG